MKTGELQRRFPAWSDPPRTAPACAVQRVLAPIDARGTVATPGVVPGSDGLDPCDVSLHLLHDLVAADLAVRLVKAPECAHSGQTPVGLPSRRSNQRNWTRIELTSHLTVAARTERKRSSAAIANNESFYGGTRTLTAPGLCAAVGDRITLRQRLAWYGRAA